MSEESARPASPQTISSRVDGARTRLVIKKPTDHHGSGLVRSSLSLPEIRNSSQTTERDGTSAFRPSHGKRHAARSQGNLQRTGVEEEGSSSGVPLGRRSRLRMKKSTQSFYRRARLAAYDDHVKDIGGDDVYDEHELEQEMTNWSLNNWEEEASLGASPTSVPLDAMAHDSVTRDDGIDGASEGRSANDDATAGDSLCQGQEEAITSNAMDNPVSPESETTTAMEGGRRGNEAEAGGYEALEAQVDGRGEQQQQQQSQQQAYEFEDLLSQITMQPAPSATEHPASTSAKPSQSAPRQLKQPIFEDDGRVQDATTGARDEVKADDSKRSTAEDAAAEAATAKAAAEAAAAEAADKAAAKRAAAAAKRAAAAAAAANKRAQIERLAGVYGDSIGQGKEDKQSNSAASPLDSLLAPHPRHLSAVPLGNRRNLAISQISPCSRTNIQSHAHSGRNTLRASPKPRREELGGSASETGDLTTLTRHPKPTSCHSLASASPDHTSVLPSNRQRARDPSCSSFRESASLPVLLTRETATATDRGQSGATRVHPTKAATDSQPIIVVNYSQTQRRQPSSIWSLSKLPRIEIPGGKHGAGVVSAVVARDRSAGSRGKEIANRHTQRRDARPSHRQHLLEPSQRFDSTNSTETSSRRHPYSVQVGSFDDELEEEEDEEQEKEAEEEASEVMLISSHAAAAAAAVAAVAKQRSKLHGVGAKPDARRRRRARVDTHRVQQTQDQADAEAKAKAAAEHSRVYVAVSDATRRWPNLSPRSAVRKEQAIRRLAVLPEGMRFYSELSAEEARRILNE